MKVICWWKYAKIHQKIKKTFKSDIIQVTKLTLYIHFIHQIIQMIVSHKAEII